MPIRFVDEREYSLWMPLWRWRKILADAGFVIVRLFRYLPEFQASPYTIIQFGSLALSFFGKKDCNVMEWNKLCHAQ